MFFISDMEFEIIQNLLIIHLIYLEKYLHLP